MEILVTYLTVDAQLAAQALSQTVIKSQEQVWFTLRDARRSKFEEYWTKLKWTRQGRQTRPGKG